MACHHNYLVDPSLKRKRVHARAIPCSSSCHVDEKNRGRRSGDQRSRTHATPPPEKRPCVDPAAMEEGGSPAACSPDPAGGADHPAGRSRRARLSRGGHRRSPSSGRPRPTPLPLSSAPARPPARRAAACLGRSPPATAAPSPEKKSAVRSGHPTARERPPPPQRCAAGRALPRARAAAAVRPPPARGPAAWSRLARARSDRRAELGQPAACAYPLRHGFAGARSGGHRARIRRPPPSSARIRPPPPSALRRRVRCSIRRPGARGTEHGWREHEAGA